MAHKSGSRGYKTAKGGVRLQKQIAGIKPHKSSHKNECSKCHKIYVNRSNLNRHTKYYCAFKIDNKNNDYFKEGYTKDRNNDDIGGANDDSNYDSADQEITILKKPQKPQKTSQKKVQQSAHMCEYCKKEFTRYDNLMRHKNKYCKVRKKNDEEMAKLLNRLIKEMEELKKTNKKLQTDIGNIKGNTNNTTTNSHNNTQNTNVQNNINATAQEYIASAALAGQNGDFQRLDSITNDVSVLTNRAQEIFESKAAQTFSNDLERGIVENFSDGLMFNDPPLFLKKLFQSLRCVFLFRLLYLFCVQFLNCVFSNPVQRLS